MSLHMVGVAKTTIMGAGLVTFWVAGMWAEAAATGQPWTNAMITALPPTLTGLAALVAAMAALKQGKKTAAKTDEIHVMVNSNLSAVKEELRVANERIKSMEENGSITARETQARLVTLQEFVMKMAEAQKSVLVQVPEIPKVQP